MLRLASQTRHQILQLAFQNYGWEDVCYKMAVKDRRKRAVIRRIVLNRNKATSLRFIGGQHHRVVPPITLPRVSILGNDQ